MPPRKPDTLPRHVPASRANTQRLSNGTVNLRMLAEHLRLSPATISLVLNNSPAGKSISQRTRDRVIAAAAQMNYRPNFFARSLRKAKSMSVGVLTPDLSEGYFTLVMQGIEEHLTRASYMYLTATHYSKADLIAEYPLSLMSRAVDGFLFLNTPSLLNLPLPIVAISGPRKKPGVTNIILNHRRAAELAILHLHQLGHRRIAIMRGPAERPDAEYRWQSMVEAARDMKLQVSPELFIELEALSPSPETACLAVQDLLKRTRDFTAILCWNDISAIGAISAIRDAGLSIPGDISVVGFDDILSAAYHYPKLTTVRQPLRAMGRRGAEVLLEKIGNPKQTFPLEIVAEPEFVVRESTGPAPSR